MQFFGNSVCETESEKSSVFRGNIVVILDDAKGRIVGEEALVMIIPAKGAFLEIFEEADLLLLFLVVVVAVVCLWAEHILGLE